MATPPQSHSSAPSATHGTGNDDDGKGAVPAIEPLPVPATVAAKSGSGIHLLPPPPPPPLGQQMNDSDGEGEWDEYDLVDEPNVDLSFPPPGTDTRSNSAPFEFVVGQHVFWPTRDGESHGVVEAVAVTDTVLTSPARAFVGPVPKAGKGMSGGGGFVESDPLPCRVRGRLSDPLYIVRDDDGRQHALKVSAPAGMLPQRPSRVCDLHNARTSRRTGN